MYVRIYITMLELVKEAKIYLQFCLVISFLPRSIVNPFSSDAYQSYYAGHT